MAGLGFIAMGISSSYGRGVSKSSGSNYQDKTKALKKIESTRKIPLKLSYEEVTLIRQLDEQGVSRKQIFADHVVGKMAYASMLNVLNYTTRVWS